MIGASDRKQAVTLINEAHSAGARKWRACEVLEISVRKFYRWKMMVWMMVEKAVFTMDRKIQ